MSKLDEAYKQYLKTFEGPVMVPAEFGILEKWEFEAGARAYHEFAKANAKPLDPHSVTQSYETQVISIAKLEEFFK